jgi:photosystem II stability/assembly factor-like uncharacterized protein
VWETTDAGRTWRPLFDGQPIGSIGAIALAPSNPRVLYVGTGEADMRSDIAQGNGAYKSTDGGRTWTHIGLADTQQIGRIVVDPRDPDRVFLAALGHPYGPNAERGVFRSTDGGRSWQKVLFKDADTGAIDLAFRPGDPSVIYAALWQTRRPPWSVYPPSNGPGSGLYKSTDGGSTWTQITGTASRPARTIGLAVAPGRPDRVYAMVDATEGGLYRSDDGGASWTRTSGDRRIWGRGWYFGGVAVEPRDADTVYAPQRPGLPVARRRARPSCRPRARPGGDDYHEMWIDSEHPERRILGVDQGAVVSLSGGETGRSWYNQPIGPDVPRDHGPALPVLGLRRAAGLGRRRRAQPHDHDRRHQHDELPRGHGGRRERHGRARPQGPAGHLRRPRGEARPAHAADADDRSRRWSIATWTVRPGPFPSRSRGAIPRVLYFARERLFRTEDGGQHWTAISPDLSREDPGVPATLDAATAADKPRAGRRHGVIYAIAPSRLADRDIWVGTDDGKVWRTRDEGAHWLDVTPAGLAPWSKVGIIDTSHFDPETAYIAVDRHRLDDFRPYVYRTHDGGRTWTAVAGGSRTAAS